MPDCQPYPASAFWVAAASQWSSRAKGEGTVLGVAEPSLPPAYPEVASRSRNIPTLHGFKGFHHHSQEFSGLATLHRAYNLALFESKVRMVVAKASS